MPIYTYSHCIICYQKDSSPAAKPPLPSEDDEDAKIPPVIQAYREMNKRREACRRFCTLASRYLSIDPYHYHPDKTLYSKHMVNTDYVCDECYPKVKEFCDMYWAWTRLQLHMDMRVNEIADKMRNAETLNISHREKLLENFKLCEEGPEELDDFRNDFMNSAERKRLENFPHVLLNMKSMEEDPDFVKVKKSKRDKKKRKNGGSKKTTKSPKKTLKSPKKKKQIHATPEIPSEQDSDIFSPVLVDTKGNAKALKPPGAKRKKESDKEREPSQSRSSKSTEVVTLEEDLASPPSKSFHNTHKRKKAEDGAGSRGQTATRGRPRGRGKGRV